MTHPRTDLVPSTDEMVGWVETICAQGIRRPGSAADVWCEGFIADRFRELGLQDVRFEPVVLPKWEPHSWSLVVASPDTTLELECFPLPHTAPAPDGVEAPLEVDDVSGSIALVTVTLNSWPQSFVRDRLALRAVDPTNEFDTISQTLPFGPQLQAVMEPSIDAGAVGFIGIFDAPWESCEYYVPYDGEFRPIPGVWISRSDGERVKALLAKGDVTARIVVDSSCEDITTHNVVGTLAGVSDEWLIVGSHHDGPWVSAVEDASGVALVLAQAKYWAQLPQGERPHNMLFVLQSGHMVHGAGCRGFIDDHADQLDSVVLEVHLEHTARESHGEDGKLVAGEAPETSWWFTSRNETLIDAVESALVAEGVQRAFIMPPDVFGPFPTTDGGFYHAAGVPLVNFLAAPMYLFDAQDTPDKLHEASMVPVTRAAIRIIASTSGVSAAQMRAGITDAG
jgi:hypothetical protein